MNPNCMNFDFDLGPEFDDFVSNAKEMARQFGERMRETAEDARPFGFDPFYRPEHREGEGRSPRFYAYPPTTIFKDSEGSLVLQFALAGVEEGAVKIGFQGDYLVLTARLSASGEAGQRYERRSFRPRDIERQKYFVPADDYDQAATRAVFRSGLLTVTVPAKDIPEADAVRITIVKEGS